MGGQKTDLIVMQGNLDARHYILMAYNFSITRVQVLLSSMAMQDPHITCLHGSFWHKITLIFAFVACRIS